MTSTARPAPARGRRRKRTSALDRAVARGLVLLERPEAPYLVLLAGFTLVGLYLRLDHLTTQSLWFDEADVVMQARAPLPAVLRAFVTAGQNGPLYTLFLHLWMALFGTSEAIVRLPSVLAGVAAIPLIYFTGRAIHGPKLGLYAAGIVTVAPYQQWYSQEAKMYALVTSATLASTLLFVLAWRTDRRQLWLGYVVVTTVALYLHVTAVLVLAAQSLWFVCTARSRPRRSRRGWLALAVLTLPYLPVAAWELRFVRGNTVTWHQPIALLAYLRDAFTHFTAGFRAAPGTENQALILFGVLTVLGALPVTWRHAPWSAPALAPGRRVALLVLLLALPLALFYVVTLVRPLYNPRYLIVVTPALYLLSAGGILTLERLARPLTLVVLALVLATAWVPLREVNLAGTAQKEDWHDAYTHIAAHVHPNDAIIVHPGYLQTTLDYYRLQIGGEEGQRLRDLPVITIPADYTDGTTDERQLDLWLQQQLAGVERVWLVLSPDRIAAPDPHDQVRDWWLRYNARLIDDWQLNGVWLGLYSFSKPFGSPYYPPPAIRLNRAIGPTLTLTGYSYDLPPSASAVRAGEYIPLVLRWVFASPQAGSFAIRWHLLGPDGVPVPGVGGSEPLLGGKPLRPWERPEEVWDYHDLALPASLPAGQYRLVIDPIAADTPGTSLVPQGLPLGWIAVTH